MKEYYSVSEAAALLHISASTLRRYTELGLVDCLRNNAGQRVYLSEHIKAFVGDAVPETVSNDRVVFYVRVSDSSPVRLDHQIGLLTESYGEPVKVFKDKASGLNEKRTGLNSLLDHARNREFDVLAITSKDRLTLFGYSYLERLLSDYQIRIVILDADNHQDLLEEELMKDFMGLIDSFACNC